MTDRSVAADESAQAGLTAQGGSTGVAALVAAREAKGLTAADVARRIRLHPRQLDAIERGDWAALPGRAFTRGAVRSYARLVEVDAAPLLDMIGGLEAAETLRPSPSLEARLPRPGGFGFDPDRRSRRLPWAILGLAGVIGLALIFGREGERWPGYAWWPTGPQSTASSTTAPSSAVPSSPAAPSSGSGQASGSVGQDGGAPLVPGASSPALVSNPSPAAAPPVESASRAGAATPAAAPADAAAANTIGAASITQARDATSGGTQTAPAVMPSGGPLSVRLLSLRQDAWVDIRDVAGKPVYMGTLLPGKPVTVSGKGPLSYTIGNANQVEVQVQGRVLDLAPNTVMPANVAKGVTP